eukprot:CAMPEP_0182913546 /NCGR_PEP_ID=MMETSP0034_2-20130328/38098_1 /TAXON_ID=156128 /ORGANISM="Nephroselmis pyriformis, Strain CCMP717" /LENGTH=263 /DNA_ID=CAMNT_0025050273 /DNA_START=53 /DNA_END=844 /DNA_ORIENTATION=-
MFCAFPRSVDPAGQLAIDLGEQSPGHARPLIKGDITPHGFVHYLSGRSGSTEIVETNFPGGAAINFIKGSASFATSMGEDGSQITVVAMGSISNWGEITELYDCKPDKEDGMADLILSLYMNGFCDQYGDQTDQPATCFGSLHGSFSFVLFDSSVDYLVAARSFDAVTPFVWGVGHEHADAKGLPIVLSSDGEGVREVCGSAADFPAGCFFQSNDGDESLQTFIRPVRRGVQPVPKMGSKGHLCGLMYKTESGADLAQMQIES